MSEKKAEVVRQIQRALDRRDWDTDLIAEDVEYVNSPYAIEPGEDFRFEWFQSHRVALEAAGLET